MTVGAEEFDRQGRRGYQLWAMLSLLRGSRTGRRGIHHGAFVHRPNPTSVASVTSGRCFFFCVVLAQDAEAFTTELSSTGPIPLLPWPSVTSVRYFSPFCVVLAQDTEVFTTELSSTGPVPLRGLCDLCAMLFPFLRGSRTGRRGIHYGTFVHRPNPSSVASVTSVRCFSLVAWFAEE